MPFVSVIMPVPVYNAGAYVEKAIEPVCHQTFEDWAFNLVVFQKVEKVVAIKDSLYNYIRQNFGSVMSTYWKKDFELMCYSQRLLTDMVLKYQIDVN